MIATTLTERLESRILIKTQRTVERAAAVAARNLIMKKNRYVEQAFALAQERYGEFDVDVGLALKQVAAIGYPVGGGSIKVDMVGTSAAPQASGEA